jgi:glycosyltransferase involved in cell wall biosynthesis
VDVFVCNSRHIARRIWRAYRRHSVVVYPPVDVDRFQCGHDREDFYLAASRFVPYKRMATIARAFAQLPHRRLIMIGDGPELRRVARQATPNVQLLGYQPFDVLHDHMRRCRAFLFAAEEDFGITPVEAQACGAPVIAYGRGGVTESVINGTTGLFFDQQTPEAIAAAVDRFEHVQDTFDPDAIRENSLRFRPEIFQTRMRSVISQAAESLGRNRLSTSWVDPIEIDERMAFAHS